MKGRGASNAAFWGWTAFLSLWTLASAMAAILLSSIRPAGGAGESLVARLLGRGASALADVSYRAADRTYHLGRAYHRETAFTNDIFQVVKREVSPTGHRHLHGAEAKEIMPWMRFAMSLDPHNVEYALDAAHIMAVEIGDPRAAMGILLQAQMNNPDSYLVHMAKGRLYAKGNDRGKTKTCYGRAWALWPGGVGREDAAIDAREILSRLAVLAEIEGNIGLAIAYMRRIVEISPDRSALFRGRIEQLQSGEEPDPPALSRWNVLREEEIRHFCEQERLEHAHRHQGEDGHEAGNGDGA